VAGVLKPPRAFARTFTVAEEYAAFNGLEGLRLNGAAPKDFVARMAVMDLDGVRLRCGGASIGLNLIGATSNNHIFAFATERAHPRLMSGREVPHDVLFHPRPNEVLATRSPSNEPFPWGSIVVPFASLAQAGPGLSGREVSPSRIDAAILRTRPAALARLLRLVADAVRLAETAPEVAESPEAAKAFSAVLVEALVDCLSQSAWEPDRAAARQHRRVMTRFHDVLRAGDEAMLSMTALCRPAGASERTLHQVCMDYVGMAPMRYVRRHRLGLVRDALLFADPRVETVTGIAMRHGFWEVSRFSSAYRQAFGETPSETLRRGFETSLLQ
jgi:AraC family ethanolamine operon transcriptional activator